MKCFLARFFFIAVVVAVVGNGASFWLKRVGLLEPEFRREYYSTYHHSREYVVTPDELRQVAAFRARLFRPVGIEKGLKLAKDGVVLLFLLVSLVVAWKRPGKWMQPIRDPVLGAMLGVVALSLVISLYRYGPVVALAGFRGTTFVLIAVLGCWALGGGGLIFFTRVLAGLLLFHLALVPYELWQGIHLFYAKFFGTDYGDRVVGTMLLPASLGIVSVLTLAMYALLTPARHLLIVAGSTVALVYFSASGTAWCMLVVLGIAVARDRVPVMRGAATMHWVTLSVLLLVPVALLLLPELTGRFDLLDSLWGRADVMLREIVKKDGAELVFGNGLGAGTNILNNLKNYVPHLIPSAATSLYLPADSTPMALIHQMGVVGMVVFYALMARAAWIDPLLRPLYLLLVLASVTVNIFELFPVNFLMGILLSGSFAGGSTSWNSCLQQSRLVTTNT